MGRPLEGIRVLDLTWALSGPFGTMVLADLGAEVIKVEQRLAGDISRSGGPFVDGISTYFFSINRGKKSITLDLKTPRGKQLFCELVEQVDVLAENFRPGTMARLDLDYEVLRHHNPRLVYAAISGFGQNGPYAKKPALDIIVQAMSGMMSITGEPDRPPMRVGASIGDITGGLYMAIGILAALHERSRTGMGQMIDISMLDCQLGLMENAYVRYLNTGEVPGRVGTRHPVFTPFQAFPTKDDWIVFAVTRTDRWALFCALIGRVDLIDDERFQSGFSRTQHVAVLEPIISEALKEKTTAEWIAEFEAIGLPCAPINTVDRAAADPQIKARGMIAEVPAGNGRRMRLVNTPIKMSRTPCTVEHRAPKLGEHTRNLVSSLLGLTQQEIDALEEEEVV